MRKLFFLSFLFVLCGCGEDVVISSNNDQYEGMIVIDVQGAVNNPGLYEVKRGAFLYEIIEIAGGLRADADINSFNAVEVIDSSISIRILSLKSGEFSSLININVANISELIKLPGIGEAKANAIIEYRTSIGRFKNVEDLKKVNGIGESLYNQIKSYITV